MIAVFGYEGLSLIVLTLLLRCGYILIHVGCIPTSNVNNIYMHNLFNIGANTLIFVLLGSAVALGDDWKGLLGVKWLSQDGYWDVVLTWSLVIHSSSIIQLVTAGRIHLVGELIVTLLYSGLIYPIVIHSAWTRDGWMRTTNKLSDVQYEDIGGGTIIHLFAGGFAFGAMIIFGGRIIKVKKLDQNSLAINAQSSSTLGYFIILASTVGLMLHSPYLPMDMFSTAQLNCIIGVSTGLVAATLFYFPTTKQSYWTTLWMLQGGLAALITLASGIGTYSLLMSLVYSTLGVTIYLLFSLLIRTSGLEDYCNIISVHLLQGFIGSVLIAFNYDIIATNPPRLSNKMLWQGICASMICFFGALSSVTIYIVLLFFGILRNKDEQDIYDAMSDFDRGCCPILRRTLDASSGDLFRPGIHTFMKFKRRHRTPQPAESEITHTEDLKEGTSLQDIQV